MQWRPLLAACIVLPFAARAQHTPDAAKTLFETTSPEVFVTVTEHPTGAEIVEVTPKAADYPRGLLEAQAEGMAAELGQRPRGLQLALVDVDGSGKPEMRFLRATFAVDGLIERNPLRLRLTPIVRGLARPGGPRQAKVLSVIFQGEAPDERTIRRFEASTVRVEGLFHGDPKAIEYRIQVKDARAEGISIPDRMPEPARPQTTERSDLPRRRLWVLVGSIVLAGLGVGALVYSAVLRKHPRER
ncbi:MAG: hypothetical protein N2109_01560 [Fimbriimonadales bacterium]|nr:hypothetical protein [Fimbriimonadales bacterium]